MLSKIAFLSHYSLSILTNSSPDLPPAPGEDREEQGGGGGAGDAAGGGQARGGQRQDEVNTAFLQSRHRTHVNNEAHYVLLHT